MLKAPQIIQKLSPTDHPKILITFNDLYIGLAEADRRLAVCSQTWGYHAFTLYKDRFKPKLWFYYTESSNIPKEVFPKQQEHVNCYYVEIW